MTSQTLWVVFSLSIAVFPIMSAIRKAKKRKAYLDSLTVEQRLLVEIRDGSFFNRVGRNLRSSINFMLWTGLILYCLGQAQHF